MGAQTKERPARRAPGGRPTKLTPTVVKALCSAIRRNATYELACASAGITYQTFRNWMIAGESGDSGPHVEFFDAIKKAEAASALKHLATVERASSRNWQAAAWMLERRYAEGYGRQKVQHEHSGPDGGPIPFELRRRDIARQLLDKLMADGISETEARTALFALGVREQDLEHVG